jgi:hypothetical protein
MVSRLAIAAIWLAPALAHGETWIGSDEVIASRRELTRVGAGLAVRRDLVAGIAAGLEGQVFEIDGDDDRRGFGFRGAAVVDYALVTLPRVEVQEHERLELDIEAGASSMVLYGLDTTAENALFGGVRLAFRSPAFKPPPGSAHAMGAHVGLRYGRGGGTREIMFRLGFEWGY